MASDTTNPTVIAPPNSPALSCPSSSTDSTLNRIKADDTKEDAETRKCFECDFTTGIKDKIAFCKACDHETGSAPAGFKTDEKDEDQTDEEGSESDSTVDTNDKTEFDALKTCWLCKEIQYFTCCRCSEYMETHLGYSRVVRYCKYCGHMLCVSCKGSKGREYRRFHPRVLEKYASWEEYEFTEVNKQTQDCSQQCHFSDGSREERYFDSCEHNLYRLCRGITCDRQDRGSHVCGEESEEGEEESVVCLLPRYIQKIDCCDCGQGMEKKTIKCEGCGHEKCADCHYLERVKEKTQVHWELE